MSARDLRNCENESSAASVKFTPTFSVSQIHRRIVQTCKKLILPTVCRRETLPSSVIL